MEWPLCHYIYPPFTHGTCMSESWNQYNSLQFSFNPLCPLMAKIGGGTLLAITCQLLERESCSNPLWMHQALWSKSEKKILFWVWASLGGTSQVGVFLQYFGHLCLALGAVPMDHFWTLNLVETTSKSASIEPLINFLAYCEQKLLVLNQK